jgi:ankyrin repeat protein
VSLLFDQNLSRRLPALRAAEFPGSELVKIQEACRHVLGDRQRPKMDLDFRGPEGDTALLACIRACNESSSEEVRKRTKIVEMLLSAGADPTIPGYDGATPLSLAKTKRLAEIETLLTRRCT